MGHAHSLADLLEFLQHAGDRGLMPAATAQALAVATRNVFAVLDDVEREAIPFDDLDGVIKRFSNKRAKDFNPASLKEYGRRVRRAVEMYQQWKGDPANFSVKTRATGSTRKKATDARTTPPAQSGQAASDQIDASGQMAAPGTGANAYQTAFPVRPGHVVVVANIPHDLTNTEAQRLAQFIQLLAPE